MVNQNHSSDSEEQTTSRKRSRKSTSAEDGNASKKRGRPRVDTHDATAADRRRTQIRLAQRAYRQRKETTITSLKKRVSTLEGAVESMNQSFLKFQGSAMNSGISSFRPELAEELKAAAEMFMQLAQDVAENANHDEDEGDVEDVAPETMTPPKKQDMIKVAPPSAPTVTSEQDHLDMRWGYVKMYQGHEAEMQQRNVISSFLSNLPDEPAPAFQKDHVPLGMVHGRQAVPMQPFQINQGYSMVPSPAADMALPIKATSHASAPYTYSFQETTFARRLQRATIERAYHLVSNPAIRPARYEQVFRLALLTETHAQIAARFRSLLVKTNIEGLDFWQAPFIHLGGAGTHYPQRDPHGNIIPIPNAWNVRRVGTFPHRAIIETSEGILQDVDLDLTPYEGEWFDPHDVQGYLEEKGCWIDPQSSFAEALIDISPAPDVTATDAPLGMDLGMANARALEPVGPNTYSRRNPRSPSSSDGTGTVPSMSSGSHSSAENSSPQTPIVVGHQNRDFGLSAPMQTFGVPGNTFDNYGFDMNSGFGNVNGPGGVFDMSFPNKGHKKRSVTVDINKLVDELINRCMCLGRAPGFRREAVDDAFHASIIISAY